MLHRKEAPRISALGGTRSRLEHGRRLDPTKCRRCSHILALSCPRRHFWSSSCPRSEPNVLSCIDLIHFQGPGPRMLPNLPEPDIGHLAKWSVSSYKFGFGAECLRDGDPDTFWQYVIPAESCPLTKNYQVLMAPSPISSRLNFLGKWLYRCGCIRSI